MMTLPTFDYDLAERVYDATLAAQREVSGMDTVAVVVVLDGVITTDLFGDYEATANLVAAHYYAETCIKVDNAVCYVIGADILD